jgi:hypothetical protein
MPGSRFADLRVLSLWGRKGETGTKRQIIPIYLQMVAQVFNLCMRRLKPAVTQNYLLVDLVLKLGRKSALCRFRQR